MRAVVQRVKEASVVVNGEAVGSIANGLLVYLGVEVSDGTPDAEYIAQKIRHLRIFPDGSLHLELDVMQAGGSVLLVSAFTIAADARKGRRPTLESAAQPEPARIFYEWVCDALKSAGLQVLRGVFGADMQVYSVNDGPVCILLDSRRLF